MLGGVQVEFLAFNHWLQIVLLVVVPPSALPVLASALSAGKKERVVGLTVAGLESRYTPFSLKGLNEWCGVSEL